jgi:RES domain-containing protein
LRLTGLVYRAHNPRWSFAPYSGEGAARYGGRFNPVGVAIQLVRFPMIHIRISAGSRVPPRLADEMRGAVSD